MKNLKFFFKYLIGLQLIILSLILRPVVRLKFGILYAERIGHLANTFDNYIYSRNHRKKIEFAFFHINSSISNTELLRLWKINIKKIFFSRLAKLIVHTNKKFRIGDDLIINWDEMETIPKKSNLCEKFINFDKTFYNNGEKILNKHDIQKPFVCLTNRDDAYVDKQLDQNFYDYKNFDFNKFNNVVNYLIKKDYSVIRVSKKTNNEYLNPSKKFFFLKNQRTDHSDIYFLAQSRYNIFGSYNGITNISGICRKKSLYLNYAPFNLKSLTTMSKFSVFNPKKIFSEKKNRFLKFSEIDKLEYDIHYPGNFFKDNNLKVIDNTEREVLDSVKEFEENFDKKDTIKSDIQKEYWKSFSNQNDVNFLRNELCISISDTFLKNNASLI